MCSVFVQGECLKLLMHTHTHTQSVNIIYFQHSKCMHCIWLVGRVTSLLQYKIHYNLCQSYTDTKWQLNMREGATETVQDYIHRHGTNATTKLTRGR